MEFHYYYIIQDVVGVLAAFIGIRMFTLCLKISLTKKLSLSSVLLLIKYILVTLAGANLLLHEFGFKPWILSIILIFISAIITQKSTAKVS